MNVNKKSTNTSIVVMASRVGVLQAVTAYFHIKVNVFSLCLYFDLLNVV